MTEKKELRYQVSFNTPAFLGNAQQQAQWRTPPFKALLRQWWRIVKAPSLNHDVAQLLAAENDLFGSAADGDEHSKNGRSKVQLRLSRWDAGTLNILPNMPSIQHPEVHDNAGNLRPVGTAVYMGFGPVTTRESRKAIDTQVQTTFSIRAPESEIATLGQVMQLIAWFGTLGSRSRNSWGSLRVTGDDILGFDALNAQKLREFAAIHPLSKALQLDWPHGFAQDANGLLIWRVGGNLGFLTWERAMEALAKIKIKFRTDLQFEQAPINRKHAAIEKRHVLSHPVTNHSLESRLLGESDRLPNSLRFKVHQSNGNFFGLIAHIPCGISKAFMPTPPTLDFQNQVWTRVHQTLDNLDPTFPNWVSANKSQCCVHQTLDNLDRTFPAVTRIQ